MRGSLILAATWTRTVVINPQAWLSSRALHSTQAVSLRTAPTGKIRSDFVSPESTRALCTPNSRFRGAFAHEGIENSEAVLILIYRVSAVHGRTPMLYPAHTQPVFSASVPSLKNGVAHHRIPYVVSDGADGDCVSSKVFLCFSASPKMTPASHPDE